MASGGCRAAAHAVEFDQIARHVFLRDDEGDAALGKSAQRLAPTVFRGGVHDIVGLRRVEIVSLDPHAGGRRQLARVGGDDMADRCRDMMLREQFDHAVAIGVADRIRRIDDDRAGLLRRLEPIEDSAAFAHGEYVGAGRLERRVGCIGGEKLDIEARAPPGPRRHGS